jgi:hypothetical protein
MTFRIVFLGLAVFFVTHGLARAVTERLVLGESAHANLDRFLLRFDFERSFVRFQNFAHGMNLRCHFSV